MERKKPLRVLIATGAMNAGGAETLIMEMLRHRSAAIEYIMLIHHSAQVLPGVYDPEIRALGVPMVYIPSVGSLGVREYTRRFQEKLRMIGPVDVLHCHLNAAGGIIARAAKKAGIPARIVHCHADITYPGGALRRALSEVRLGLMKLYVNRFANAFWACSEAAGRRLFYRNKPVQVIPNVIDVRAHLCTPEKRAESRRRFDLPDRLVLGSVGRIAAIKNYAFALEVVHALKQSGTDCLYVIFGRAADGACFRSLQEKIRQLGLEDTVRFLGNSSRIAKDIACIDLFLMPSISEGFGIAAIEAQAAGLPVFASEGVSRETDMGLDLIRFLPCRVPVWVEEIKKAIGMPRPDPQRICAAIGQKGFDSVTAVQGIEAQYLALVRSKEN